MVPQYNKDCWFALHDTALESEIWPIHISPYKAHIPRRMAKSHVAGMRSWQYAAHVKNTRWRPLLLVAVSPGLQFCRRKLSDISGSLKQITCAQNLKIDKIFGAVSHVRHAISSGPGFDSILSSVNALCAAGCQDTDCAGIEAVKVARLSHLAFPFGPFA